MHSVRLVFTTLLLGIVATARATVLPVPSEYATIQEALDATNAWDTVLVAPGDYHEFLMGPPHSFVLMGEYPPDSGSLSVTTLDPIITEPDTPSTIQVSADTVLIKNLAFFNCAGLRQDFATRSGGVQNSASKLIVQNCRFDSVSAAIRHGHSIEVLDCRFTGCVRTAIQADSGGRITARRCTFEASAYSIVTGYDGTIIEDCEFICNTQYGHYVVLGGEGIVVRNCRFGPCLGAFSVLSIYSTGSNVIEENVFEGLNRSVSIIEAESDCSTLGGVPLTIRANVFQNNYTVPPHQGTTAIDARCADETYGKLVVIQSNMFADGSTTVLASGLYLKGSALLEDNTFVDLLPEDRPDVYSDGEREDTVFARNNSFLFPGLAAKTLESYFDARENWWGDSTGPFNSALNPNGMGSEVGNGVEFIPWLTSPPDSADTSEVSTEEMLPMLPSEFRLEVFPNPFNAVAQLSIFVRTPGIYDVVLYDVTGREAVRIQAGYIRSKSSVRLDMNRLASGVYIAALHAHDKTLATTKLLLLR